MDYPHFDFGNRDRKDPMGKNYGCRNRVCTHTFGQSAPQNLKGGNEIHNMV